jgi:hypothetical protein
MDQSHHLLTYVLPLRSPAPQVDREFCDYLKFISSLAELIVVDGSSKEVFDQHAGAWGMGVVHVPPSAALATPMGKVGGVMTGVHLASHDKVIIADDDIRYDADSLMEVSAALDEAQVIRPQNFITPLPWHAVWDSGRILLNRISGGDWPGTLGVSRSALLRAGGYDGKVMFENLELVRTIVAAGGNEQLLLGTLVARRPSSTRHFFSQRVRQAYDEFARPWRLAFQLSLMPLAIFAALSGRVVFIGIAALTTVIFAEIGRRRAGATRVFPFAASLAAPFWLLERAVCAWLAVACRVVYGGVPYRGRVLRKAATPLRKLRARFGGQTDLLRSAQEARYRSA